jgi:hypothetical protein
VNKGAITPIKLATKIITEEGKGEISAFQSLRNGCVRKRTQANASERKRTQANARVLAIYHGLGATRCDKVRQGATRCDNNNNEIPAS